MMKPVAFLSILVALSVAGCSTPGSGSEVVMDADGAQPATPPPALQAWMDRLTVEHEYDPDTGGIVARETIELPSLIADAPTLDVAIEEAGDARLVIAFATAERCAPCQQYKRDALNDGEVIAVLSDDRFLATHVEVDRSPELVDAHLGSRGIPMTYALRDGEVIAQLRGQRSASDLLGWLESLPE
ncbi:MAG: thioredoxin family protein [Phycisphaerales bacterium]